MRNIYSLGGFPRLGYPGTTLRYKKIYLIPNTPSHFYNFLTRLVTQGKGAKRAYKEAFEALAKAKAKMEASAIQEEGLRKDMLDSFDSYCEAKVRNSRTFRESDQAEEIL